MFLQDPYRARKPTYLGQCSFLGTISVEPSREIAPAHHVRGKFPPVIHFEQVELQSLNGEVPML
jgi:hypothetical protein